MRTHPLLCVLLASLLLGLTAPRALPGAPAAGARTHALPYLCFTPAWDASFKVVDAHFDRAGERLVWVLEAKKDTRVSDYVALLTDPDGLEVATVKVNLYPNRPTVKAKGRVVAVVTLGWLATQISKLIIRDHSRTAPVPATERREARLR